MAATGAAYAFLSPALGWVGTAVAGSVTSTGALFANLQATAAQGAGLDPKILLAANTIGGGLGKIVSPQNLAIASTAVDAPGSFATPGAPCVYSRPRRRIGDVLLSRGLRSPTDDCAPARAFWRQTQSSPRKYVLAAQVRSRRRRPHSCRGLFEVHRR